MKPSAELDCTTMQRFLEQYPNPTLEIALRQVPHLVEALVTHNLVPSAPSCLLPPSINNLRAFGLNLIGVDISRHVIRQGYFRGVNFTGVIANGALFQKLKFTGCYLHGSDFFDAKFEDCVFVGCEISKNDFRKAVLLGSSFDDCDLYANWATDTVLPENLDKSINMTVAFGAGERSPWDEGLCDGHEISA